MFTRKFWRLGAGTLVLSCFVCPGILASNGHSDSDVALPESQSGVVPVGFTTFGHLPANCERIVVFSEDANLKVVRDAQAADISIASNCPAHWNVAGCVVRQAVLNNVRSGSSMKADALGSRAIVNGKVYLLPSGGIHGGLKLDKNGVCLGGEQLPPLAGTPMPGVCQGEDEVIVVVPASYAGDLTIGSAGHSQIALPKWKGGSVKLTLLDATSLSAGTLSQLDKAAIDMHGSGQAEIKDLSAKFFVANVNGSGTIDIDHGSAKMSNATVSGAGQIKMKGEFENLKQAVNGSGSIEVH